MKGLMWSEEFFYHRCHERELTAVLYALTAEVGTAGQRAAIAPYYIWKFLPAD